MVIVNEWEPWTARRLAAGFERTEDAAGQLTRSLMSVQARRATKYHAIVVPLLVKLKISLK